MPGGPRPPALGDDLAAFIAAGRQYLTDTAGAPIDRPAVVDLYWECRRALDHPDRPRHRDTLRTLMLETIRRNNGRTSEDGEAGPHGP